MAFLQPRRLHIQLHEHSSIWAKNAPADWRACSVIKGDTAQTSPSNHSISLFNREMLVMFGDVDSVVWADEVSADLIFFIDVLIEIWWVLGRDFSMFDRNP